MDQHLTDVHSPNLAVSEPVSTSHLEVQTPASIPYLDETDPCTNDIESAARDIQDVSPARTARSGSADLDLRVAEEVTNAPFASVQVPTRFRCGMTRRDGSPCHKTFDTRERMRQHQSTSAHTDPVMCPFCLDRLRQPRALFLHVEMYHPEELWTDYRCRVCGSDAIRSQRGLNDHVKRYHGELSLQEQYQATRGF
jgi:hypothetical protein